MIINQSLIKSVLDYNPETGVFTWLKSGQGFRGIKAGDVAGGIAESGYVLIRIKGQTYRAHRLAWVYMTGEQPPEFMDHKDRNRANNRWDNLRPATMSQNHMNAIWPRKGPGLKGTYFHKQCNLWHARIKLNRKYTSLGYFKTTEEAHKAYQEAASRMFGDYACME